MVRVGEDDLIDLATSVCNADLEEGDWLSMYDVTQKVNASLNLFIKWQFPQTLYLYRT